MASKREALERDYEELLIDILEQDHDLAVRRNGDSLNRRRNDVATLQFAYQYVSGRTKEGKVSVSIDGFPGFSVSLVFDFSDEDELQRSAENTEGLALFLSEHLSGKQDDLMNVLAEGKLPYGRREDD
ncbi:MAG: hypothetical protein GY725_00980 [bacterium]|nr:hypothetical protein [bacterium]